jgi:hypothetical protein
MLECFILLGAYGTATGQAIEEVIMMGGMGQAMDQFGCPNAAECGQPAKGPAVCLPVYISKDCWGPTSFLGDAVNEGLVMKTG